MTMSAWLIALVVVILVGLFVTWRSAAAQRWYDRSERTRKLASIIGGTLIAIVFLASGDPVRSFVGIVLVALVALYLFIEEPWRHGI